MRYHLTPYDGCLVAKSCLTPVTPWTIACQAPLSIRFSRQEDWSRLPFPSPGDLPNPGIEPASPALAGEFFTTEPQGSPMDVSSFTSIYSPLAPSTGEVTFPI